MHQVNPLVAHERLSLRQNPAGPLMGNDFEHAAVDPHQLAVSLVKCFVHASKYAEKSPGVNGFCKIFLPATFMPTTQDDQGGGFIVRL